MPREIIDTQTSRPRYVRRMAFTIAGVLVVFAAVIYAAVALIHH